MSTGTTIAIVAGGVLLVGVVFVVVNRQQQQVMFNQPPTSQTGLQGDAALLYAGLAGGGSLIAGILQGVGAMQRRNTQQYPPINYDPSRPIGPGNSPVSFGPARQGT